MRDFRRGSVDILLVDPNPDDAKIIKSSLADLNTVNSIRVTDDGEEALKFVAGSEGGEDAPRPNLVLLDVYPPQADGFEILEELKSEPESRCTPVIVLTRSDAREDIVKSYDLHANAVLRKPDDPDTFRDVILRLVEFWFTVARLPVQA